MEGLRERFAEHGYVAGEELATGLELALALEKPLLVEGQAGVGKTESAKVLAAVTGRPLIRLQCYEGLDAASALYEWNYPKQLLHMRLTDEIFSEAYLLRRPLLEAIAADVPTVLLVDEVDRADEAFEAFLLELLGEFQVTIPEIGTVRARHRPAVILTSNRTRELSDALRRRALYVWIDYPSRAQELTILRARLPGIDEQLAVEAVAFVERLRDTPLEKAPGVAETIDWAQALLRLGCTRLDDAAIARTLGCLVKSREDIDTVRRLLAG